MGYNTYFDGQVRVVPPLNETECALLEQIWNGKHPEGEWPASPNYGYLQWVPQQGEGWTDLVWDEGEKFYDHLLPAGRPFTAALGCAARGVHLRPLYATGRSGPMARNLTTTGCSQ